MLEISETFLISIFKGHINSFVLITEIESNIQNEIQNMS